MLRVLYASLIKSDVIKERKGITFWLALKCIFLLSRIVGIFAIKTV